MQSAVYITSAISAFKKSEFDRDIVIIYGRYGNNNVPETDFIKILNFLYSKANKTIKDVLGLDLSNISSTAFTDSLDTIFAMVDEIKKQTNTENKEKLQTKIKNPNQ